MAARPDPQGHAGRPGGNGGLMMVPRIAINGARKTFPGVLALNNVSVQVAPGEIHALLGENGAGKSTLGKIIAGVYRADAGSVQLDGRDIGPIDERDAAQLGIAIVHQEGSLVEQLSVAENVFAGHAPTVWPGRIDRDTINKRTAALIARLGVRIDPRRRVADLAPAEAQVVEIAKALSRDLRVLILDEPTAALTLTESERLFDIVRGLATDGVSIIYVSHRLAEIFQLCHRVTVLKDGALVGTREVANATAEELIRMMVGRDVTLDRGRVRRAAGAPMLEATDIMSSPMVRGMSLTVHAGEIVCLAGLIGAGRTEFCEAVFGVRARQGGLIRVNGVPINPKEARDGMSAGIGMVPEDRKNAGLFLNMTVRENITVTVAKKLNNGIRRSEAKAEALARRYIGELKIATPNDQQVVGNLSGGNQQKVLIAKWLAMQPRLLIVDEPTRGVDVGARAEIYRLLRGLAEEGVALLVVSSDLPEVLALADRIVVMADGCHAGELPGEGATEEQILRLATLYTTSLAVVQAEDTAGVAA
jgi:ribose transport system ATP-binding protein/rhamnose transport system ATP-binding protein